MPQPPQLETVLRGDSQPLPCPPSQLPNPGSQLITMHAPVAHVGVALGVEQEVPQVPQFVSVVVLVSQPLLKTPSQFP